jgi:O-antigen/teichoic acid export membrane protein
MSRRANLFRLLRGGGLVTLGNVAAAGLGLVLLLMLGRSLTPAELAIVIGVIAIIDGGQMFLVATVNTGMINLASRHGAKGAPSPALLRAGFWTMLVLGLAFAAVAAAASYPLSMAMLGDGSMTPLLVLAGLAAAASGITSFAQAVVTAEERFGRVAFLSVWKNLLRILVLAPLLWAGAPEVLVLALAICGASAATALIAAMTISWSFLRTQAPLRKGMAALLGVNGWLALSALGMLGGRLDIWLVGWLGSAEQAGLYAVAAQLCVGVGVVTQALVTTLLPAISRFRSADEMRGFLGGGTLTLLPLALLPLIAVPLAGPMLSALFGPDYIPAAGTFVVLFAASIMSLAGAPLMLTLLSVGEARMLALGTLLQFALRVALAFALVPVSGAIGMAVADVLSRLIAMLLVALFIWRVLKTRLEDEPAAKSTPATETV